MAFENFNLWYYWLILVVSLLLLTLALYLGVRIICGRKKLDASYFFRLFFVSIILLVAVEAVAQALATITDILVFSTMFYIFLTIGFILVIRYLLMVPAVLPHAAGSGDKYWQWSIWITIISLFLILAIAYIIYAISSAFGQPLYIFVPG
ncbi:MAG: hypothetical protein ACTSXO_05665 [Candidatus Heimdallarchaeota archaeon]|nr:MAG: hypothetical protein DRO63_01115 [Candidatus Gerdarchaeota archaeon]RLI70528.1 MAG: hypothetical protein DRO91_06640 [Candidatus Heimdallarchaeota archaeon]RLI72092.1 MAG: hypothetical protein DRP02_02825 [Candidatus Gerdarchaeota archaeon]